jgi:hypothetical protein
MTHPNVTYSSGIFTNPAIDGDNVIFAGTQISFQTGPAVLFSDGKNHVLNSIIEHGSPGSLASGLMDIFPPLNSNVTITHGLNLSFGDLALGSANGGTWTIDGRSTITNGSTFTASGGRYAADPFILNGRMTVSNGSSADFLAPVQGSGTIDVDAGSTVDLDRVTAGLHVDLAGGSLITGQTFRMAFLGTIHESASGSVDVMNAAGATEEIFHRSTGMLDLVNGSGTTVAALKFSGDPTLYTTPNGSGGMDITTTHQAASLPTIVMPH